MTLDKNNNNKTTLIPGIDLGTTNSAAAVYSTTGGKVEDIPNESGDRTTPSLVYFPLTGPAIIGENARKYMEIHPKRVVYEFKRLMGRRFDDPGIQEFIKKCSYEIIRGSEGEAKIRVGDKEYFPKQISALILEYMKGICENYLSAKVTEMVVTVPANFNDAQRQDTKDAGAIAGLVVKRILNEPTAAALAYGLDKTGQKGSTIAVFDLGGGTFDVSILTVEDKVFEVKATDGDPYLGGSDFDHELVLFFLKKAKEELKIDLSSDKLILQRFKAEAIKAKHHLSQAESYDFNLAYISFDKVNNVPIHFKGRILRVEFERMVEHLLKRLVKPCKDCLKNANVKNIDQVILVGGMTRVPIVQKTVEDIFKLAPNKSANPDLIVAQGAAIQGSILSGATQDVLLLDVTPLSLGIETFGGILTPIIKRNTAIPISSSKVFSTAQDNQPAVTITVIEGESERASSPANRVLDTFSLTDIRPAPQGVPQIEVKFDLDANGILTVSAKDKDTGKVQHVVVTRRTKDEEKVKEMIKEAEAREEQDREFKANADLLITANGYVYSLNKDLENFKKHNLENETQYSELESLYKKIKEAVDNTDYESLKQQLKTDNVSDLIIRLTNELREKLPKEQEGQTDKEDKNSDNDGFSNEGSGDREN